MHIYALTVCATLINQYPCLLSVGANIGMTTNVNNISQIPVNVGWLLSKAEIWKEKLIKHNGSTRILDASTMWRLHISCPIQHSLYWPFTCTALLPLSFSNKTHPHRSNRRQTQANSDHGLLPEDVCHLGLDAPCLRASRTASSGISAKCSTSSVGWSKPCCGGLYIRGCSSLRGTHSTAVCGSIGPSVARTVAKLGTVAIIRAE